MSRELKFRAWDIFKKVFIPTDVYAIITTDFKAFGIMLKDWEDYKEGEYFYENTQALIQFTGFKGKTGTDIYVGHILSEKWRVEVYQNDEGTFMVKFHTNPKMNKPISLKQYLLKREKAGMSDRDSIIIGSIYENPELLK